MPCSRALAQFPTPAIATRIFRRSSPASLPLASAMEGNQPPKPRAVKGAQAGGLTRVSWFVTVHREGVEENALSTGIERRRHP
jgi:hypothetical protein